MVQKSKRIKKVAFVYLAPKGGDYYITDDPGYSIQKRPQLGLQYLCAILEKRGIKTNIFDQTIILFNLKQLIEKLKDYDIVGFYCSDPQEKRVKRYCKEIKKKLKIIVLVGGPSTLTNSSFLKHRCDIVVHGEGEKTIQDIVDFCEGKIKIKNIKGISYKKGKKIITTPPQDLIKNLDELPFPDRSKINVKKYHDWFLFGMKKPYITMIASRGCINRCAYCTSCKIWRYKYRQRSVDNVLSEINDLVKRYKVKYIAFQDDVFGITNQWIEEFCIKLMKKPYRIRWMAILHPFSIKTNTKRILELMKKAGCDTLTLGVQSAHPKILRNINRHPDEPKQLEKILKIAEKLRFITALSFIFGLPGDTKKTIQTTIKYALKCRATLVQFYVLSILRGSEIGIKYKNKKICDLTNEEIKKFAVVASRKFYMRLKPLLKIAYFILKNPTWVINIVNYIPSLLARIGFVNIKKRFKKDGIIK